MASLYDDVSNVTNPSVMSKALSKKPLCWCCPTCVEARGIRMLKAKKRLLKKSQGSMDRSSASPARLDGSSKLLNGDCEGVVVGGVDVLSLEKNGNVALQNGYVGDCTGNGLQCHEKLCKGNQLQSIEEVPQSSEEASSNMLAYLVSTSPKSSFKPAPVGEGVGCRRTSGGDSDEDLSCEEDGSDSDDVYSTRFNLEADPLEHLVEVLKYHPQYLACFLNAHRYLLYGNGPLPYHYRHYIAIMAAATNRCSYLVHAESALFVMQGGEKAWLRGLSHVPRKLRLLNDLNTLLAHRPWLLRPQHITALIKDDEDKWTLSELAHAIVLFGHFHALSSFVLGCGISDDSDHFCAKSRSISESSTERSPGEGAIFNADGLEDSSSLSIEELIEKMRILSEEQNSGLITSSSDSSTDRFDRVESLAAELKSSPKRKPVQVQDNLKRFVSDPEYSYMDFYTSRAASASSGTKVHTYIHQDFSWEDQGYSLSSRLYMEIGDLLDEKFTLAQQLTYFTCGSASDVDTTLFREAVWKFVHCVYGIRHDDYNYALVSRLLDKNLRSFIKSVACYPYTVTRSDYCKINTDFQMSERVHINIMIMESRMQAELLYGLRAVYRHINRVTDTHT